jgi:hypothetical protein
MSRCNVRRWLVLALLLGSAAGCDGCGKKDREKPHPKPAPVDECSVDSDCNDDNPCTAEQCRLGKCALTNLPETTSCENDSVCDGISKCDGKGHCVAGPPPVVDDGNPCTTDACDAVRGAVHTPVPIDDDDACTLDACDEHTGVISHEPIDLDDKDDCTFDTCDPKSGPKHQKPDPLYACEGCGQGFHTASRAANRQCGGPQALQSFCVPDCGPSFYSCDASCPKGYAERSRAPNRQCGTAESEMIFCLRSSP